jgi:UrcA family protein
MKMSNLSKISMAIAIAALPFATAYASDEIGSVRVRIGDLNLASVQGQKTLALRIDRAARDVCDTANDRFGPKVLKTERLCREEVTANAIALVKAKGIIRLAAQ